MPQNNIYHRKTRFRSRSSHWSSVHTWHRLVTSTPTSTRDSIVCYAGALHQRHYRAAHLTFPPTRALVQGVRRATSTPECSQHSCFCVSSATECIGCSPPVPYCTKSHTTCSCAVKRRSPQYTACYCTQRFLCWQNLPGRNAQHENDIKAPTFAHDADNSHTVTSTLSSPTVIV